MEIIGLLWNEIIVRPMLNSLVLLYGVLFNNFGLSIIVFTFIVRLLTLPLTLRQIRQTRGMSALQPKMKELQARYKDDRQRMSRETMRLYKEQGISPMGCLGPMVIQFPIWIGLYQSISRAMTVTPESLVGLSQRLYFWIPQVEQVVPFNSSFLWLDLALPDPTPIMPILVGASMWLMQKITMMPSVDPRQASTNRMMLWMMPLMFGFFTFQFPSGLPVYWISSNLIGIGIQYFVTGWQPIFTRAKSGDGPTPIQQSVKEISSDGKLGDDSQDSGGGPGASPKTARRRARRSRSKRH